MNKPNIIITPSGDRMGLIPVEEYERLIEAAEDAADASLTSTRSSAALRLAKRS